jgi:hypothetical protein
MSSVVKAVAGVVVTAVGLYTNTPQITAAGVSLIAGGASENVAERKAEKREESARNAMAEQTRRASEETAGVKEAARRQSELMTKRRGFASTILTSPTRAVGSVPGTKTTLG